MNQETTMKKLLVVLSLVGFVGCADTKVEVECLNNPPSGFNCKVQHKEGSSTAKACWTVEVSCQNGSKLTASSCATVQKEQYVTTVVPYTAFGDSSNCDPTGVAVNNLKVTKE